MCGRLAVANASKLFSLNATMTSKPKTPANTSGNKQFDWDLIQSFVAVMEAGSLTGAARALSSTQPTLSRHIELLEIQLGKVLFERTGRGLEPTYSAHTIAKYAYKMRSEADSLARAAAAEGAGGRPFVRIAASRQLALQILPTLITEIQSRSPEIDIGIVASDDVSNLLRRDADIAIRNVRPDQSSLIAKRLGETPVKAYASNSYLKRNGRPTSLSDLVGHRLVGGDRDSNFARSMEQAAQSIGACASDIRVAVRSDDYVDQFAAVKEGLGIGFSLACFIERHKDLTELPLNLPLPTVPFWLVVHREIRTAPAIRVVFDTLSQLLKEQLKR